MKQKYNQFNKIHSQLDHPNIVKMISSTEDDSHYYLIMELCEMTLF